MRGVPIAPKNRGAAMVEFAIAFPLILMLLVGMITAAVAYNHQLALSHAAREGSRLGATLPVSNYASLDAWLDAVAQAVGDDATGTLGDGVPGRYVCVAYLHPTGTLETDSTRRRVEKSGAQVYSDAGCFVDGRPDAERRVQVQVRRDTDLSLAFFSTTLTLDSDGTSRFEAAVGG